MENFTEFIRDTHLPNKIVIGIGFIQVVAIIVLLIHARIYKEKIIKQQKSNDANGYDERSINPTKQDRYSLFLIVSQLILAFYHFKIVNTLYESGFIQVVWFLVLILSLNLILFNKYYHFVFVIFCFSFIIKKLYDKYM
tara:strand:- start:217 stop:633 length:417 start_codon:yes stop_codon:yes gene_type:complete